jgi:hypothetical protein
MKGGKRRSSRKSRRKSSKRHSMKGGEVDPEMISA